MAEMDPRQELELLRQADSGNPRLELEALRALDVEAEPTPPTVGKTFAPLISGADPAASAEVQKAFDERDARKASQIKELKGLFGDQFDSDNSFPQDFSDYFSIIDLGRSKDLITQQQKFLEAFPQGSLVRVPTKQGSMLLARKNATDPLREVPSGLLTTGALAAEPLALGVAGGIRFGVAGTFRGTAGGLIAHGLVETARGFQSIEDVSLFEAGIEGGQAALMDFIFRGAGRYLFGGGKGEVARAAVKAARDEGLEQFAVGQISQFVVIRDLFLQTGKITGRVSTKIEKEAKSLFKLVEQRAEAGSGLGVSDDALKTIVEGQNQEIARILAFPRTLSRESVRRTIVEGSRVARIAGKAHIGRLYGKAFKLDKDVIFNMGKVQDKTVALQRGVLDVAEDGTVTKVSGTLPKELLDVMDDVMALPSRLTRNNTGPEFSSFEKAKALRTRVFDLKEANVGEVRKAAKILYKELTDMMDNPISGNPEFVKAYRAASAANAIFEDNMAKLGIVKLLSSKTTFRAQEAAARAYLGPGNTASLGIIKSALPRETWDAFRKGYPLKLSGMQGRQALRELEEFAATDQQGLRLLMSKGEERQLRKGLLQKARYDSSPVRKVLESNMEEAERSLALIKTGTAKDVSDFVRLAGGPESEGAMDLVAAIFKDLLDNAGGLSRTGQNIIDPGSLQRGIAQWIKSGKLKNLVSSRDWQRLQNLRTYSVVFEAADIGGGMMAGSFRQKIVKAAGDIAQGKLGSVGVIAHIAFSNQFAGWLLSRSGIANKILAPKILGDISGRFGAAYQIVRQELEKREEKKK